jgi:hypothetical protein
MVTRKTPAVRIACSAAFLVLALALVPAALAKGKPGGGSTSGSSTISLAPLVYDANGNGLPNYGDIVVFNVSTTATTQPFVNLQCFQNGALVESSTNGYFVGSFNPTGDFGLNSPAWHGGAADCTAWLEVLTNQGFKHLGSTSFHVDG